VNEDLRRSFAQPSEGRETGGLTEAACRTCVPTTNVKTMLERANDGPGRQTDVHVVYLASRDPNARPGDA